MQCFHGSKMHSGSRSSRSQKTVYRSRAGVYYCNLKDSKERISYQMETFCIPFASVNWAGPSAMPFPMPLNFSGGGS